MATMDTHYPLPFIAPKQTFLHKNSFHYICVSFELSLINQSINQSISLYLYSANTVQKSSHDTSQFFSMQVSRDSNYNISILFDE